jgi:hypothetical protein
VFDVLHFPANVSHLLTNVCYVPFKLLELDINKVESRIDQLKLQVNNFEPRIEQFFEVAL